METITILSSSTTKSRKTRGPRQSPQDKRELRPVKTGKMIPCPGEAHLPEVAGNIDHCGICMPRWGQIEETTDVTFNEAIATGKDIRFGYLSQDQQFQAIDMERQGVCNLVTVTNRNSSYTVVRF